MSEMQILKPSQLAVLLTRTIPAKLPVMVVGAPGIGKTDIIKAAASKCNADLIIAHPVVDDPVDYKGLPAITDGQAQFLPIGILKQILAADRLTVVFFDDAGQASPAVQAALMQLVLERSINGVRIPDHIVFVIATNRRQDKAGVTGILEPLKSRFATIVELQPDKDDWILWAFENDVPTELIAFIEFRPNLLWDFKPTAEMKNHPCPRTVANVGKLMKLGLPEDIETAAITGAVGDGFTIEFQAFRKIYEDLPNIKECLANPETCVIPSASDDPAIMYAFSCALAECASEENTKAFFILVDRMDSPEFKYLTIKMAIKRNPDMKFTKEYAQFLITHLDLFIGE